MADDNDTVLDALDWLTLPEVGERIGEAPGRVRRLLDERALVALRRDGVLRVPAAFVDGGRVLPSLRGTVIVLGDVGFTDDEIVVWLFTLEESLGHAPIESLLAGRKAEVRRVAQTLA
ncbi:Rv2175c family DNA-binding protein [Microbacterium sp. ZXX196]|uniref:Rv2175c family DNA-binding protein n=1 Tax=Microbacterium sp. ZXX196 TaxID=2609291 RepID=UPI0034D17336